MNINEFIPKKDNIFIIKYKNKSYDLNIDTHHIFIFKNKVFLNIGFFLGKKIVIDFKKFKALISKTKIIEVTDIISKNNEYILLESFYDIIRLCKSTFYEYVNKLLIDKTLLLDDTIKTNIISYLNDNNIKDFINVIKKEIKKIDKAFITFGIKNKDKVFYGTIETKKLNKVGDKLNVSNFMKLSKSVTKDSIIYKINIDKSLPYILLTPTEKHILLPRNIILEVISIDNNVYTLLAKPKNQEQFNVKTKSIIKSDLYNIKLCKEIKGGTPSAQQQQQLEKLEIDNIILKNLVIKIKSFADKKYIDNMNHISDLELIELFFENKIDNMINKLLDPYFDYSKDKIFLEKSINSVLTYKIYENISVTEYLQKENIKHNKSDWKYIFKLSYNKYYNIYEDIEQLLDPNSGIIENYEIKELKMLEDPVDKYLSKLEKELELVDLADNEEFKPKIAEYNKLLKMSYTDLVRNKSGSSKNETSKSIIPTQKKKIILSELKCNNTTDPITLSDIDDENYPLAKLELTIGLKTGEITHCFYAPDLYNYLVTLFNKKAPLINPLTKKKLTKENIDILMDTIHKIDPNIERPERPERPEPKDTELKIYFDKISIKIPEKDKNTSGWETKPVDFYEIKIKRLFGSVYKFEYIIYTLCTIPLDINLSINGLTITSDKIKSKITELFNNSQLLNKYVPPYYTIENNENKYIKLNINDFKDYKDYKDWMFPYGNLVTKDTFDEKIKQYITDLNIF